MPFVDITIVPGRSAEKKEELMKKVTDAIADTLQIPEDRVHIVIHEVSRENIADGGVPLTKAKL